MGGEGLRSVKGISLRENTLYIELPAFEAKIISKCMPLAKPFLAQYIYMMARIMLAMASLGKETRDALADRLERGEEIPSLLEEAGIDMQTLFDKDWEFPTGEEIDRILGWGE